MGYIIHFVADDIYLNDNTYLSGIYKHNLFIASVNFPLLSNIGIYEEQDSTI